MNQAPPPIALIAALQRDVGSARADSAALQQEIAALRQQIADLQRQLDKNSSNSGKLPSSDDLKGTSKNVPSQRSLSQMQGFVGFVWG